ncbi:MAG: hypothetical protein H6514_09600 [Acidimicrobiaceae bacterium]|nr:hypothetical protein [Acidimicrobiaceae bacterium]
MTLAYQHYVPGPARAEDAGVWARACRSTAVSAHAASDQLVTVSITVERRRARSVVVKGDV